MIIQTKTGTKITGTLSRDPSLKETKTGKPFLSLSVKAHSTNRRAILSRFAAAS